MTPRRTRAHRIADLSVHHLEGFVLRQGHTLEIYRNDYGYDVALYTYAYDDEGDGEIEPGEIKNQLKATDSLKILADGKRNLPRPG